MIDLIIFLTFYFLIGYLAQLITMVINIADQETITGNPITKAQVLFKLIPIIPTIYFSIIFIKYLIKNFIDLGK